ncbi:hypothetical protein EAI91_05080 [Lacticaseibacillus paracasei]|nr:hypothetical protein DBQ61_05395 [Lactobacillus sp. DS22_6]RHX73901.1 hypothetical protein D2U14_04220 [Lacticaseibacillus paracasei]RYT00202.1 hypothetical protein EAI91_05080 [Lacticaseibacillus paracasei]
MQKRVRRFLIAPAHALKRDRQPRNLRVRTLDAMTKAQSSDPRPLTLRFLTGLAHALYLLGVWRDGRLNMYFLNGRGCMVSELSSTCTKQKYTILSCVSRRKEECSHGTRHS